MKFLIKINNVYKVILKMQDFGFKYHLKTKSKYVCFSIIKKKKARNRKWANTLIKIKHVNSQNKDMI